jgi:NAD(P)-dependent dehydrogenase (short-subunit alcohol dehydrogenase family)
VPGEFAGKVAFVTGAASGIGRESARLFARQGADVVVVDRDEEGGREAVELVRAEGQDAEFVLCDVAVAEDVRAAVAAAVRRFGGIQLAHNNAGVEGPVASTVELSPEEFDRVISINLRGVWLSMKHQLPELARGGAIVNTSSVLGIGALPQLPAYVAAKHGVVGLTRVAALEHAAAGVRINAVLPGSVRTGMMHRAIEAGHMTEEGYVELHPIGRPADPEEIAEAAVWLCSSRSSFVTGHALVLDGGMSASV